MANFIAAREFLAKGDVVIVQCSHQCNVLVMDDQNFQAYRQRKKCTYFGGHFKAFPAKVAVPANGHWNTVIDVGGAAAAISHTISYIRQTKPVTARPAAVAKA
ncbi:MAG: DUF1883 domain-containing protein [Rhizobium sp.]|nr:DUF1883 domain-containing protein [Rhizobium sp.]